MNEPSDEPSFEFHQKVRRTSQGEYFISDLRGEIASGESTGFNRSLLAEIDAFPEKTIK